MDKKAAPFGLQPGESDEALEVGQDAFNFLKNKGKEWGGKYGPQFKKYLDKALQYAKPAKDRIQEKLDKFTNVNAPSDDATSAYENIRAELVGFSKNIIPQTDKLLKAVYDSHVKLKESFRRADAIAAEMKNHVRDGKIYLNEDSAGLMDALEQERSNIRNMVNKMLDDIEAANDSLTDVNIEGRQYKFKHL